MKIAESTVPLESQHASVKRHSVRESLRFWTSDMRPDFESRERGLNNAASENGAAETLQQIDLTV